MLRKVAYAAMAWMMMVPALVQAQEAKSTTLTKEEVLKVQPTDMVLGQDDAPITMLEFASLSCSHCAHFHLNILPKIKENYVDTGKVKVIMRDFPLNEPALRAAQLTNCTDDVETFHRLTTAVFRTQSTWVGKKNYLELLGNIGKLAGISGDEYDACLKDKDLELSLLTNKYNGAKVLGINATPSFVINGEVISGGRDYPFFQETFDAILGE